MFLLQSYFNKIQNSKYLQNIAILSGGTLIARAILVLSSPIITRLYLPQDFGVLAIFISVVSMLLIISTYNYNTAILIPISNVDVFHLTVLSFIILVFNTVVCMFIFYSFNFHSITIGDLGILEDFKWLLLLSLFGGGLFNILYSFSIRYQFFRPLARRRIFQSLFQFLTQLLSPILDCWTIWFTAWIHFRLYKRFNNIVL